MITSKHSSLIGLAAAVLAFASIQACGGSDDPPATPQVLAGSLYAGSSHYDRIGRYYTTGVRVKF